MPFAQIYMLEGRTPEQKKAVIEKVTQALHEAVDAPKQTIRVCGSTRCRKRTGASPA
jgi:4-oxalocrotonate tautomerase